MQFRADSLPVPTKLFWEKTTHGYVAFATLAKIGHPLEYLSDDGETSTEVLNSFSEDSISSIRGMPLCLGHPQTGTYQGNQSGAEIGHFLQEIIITDSGELLAPVTITDKRGIDLIEDCLLRGLTPEISPAYWVESVALRQDGNFEQSRGKYDHAALLMPGNGRGGAAMSLRLDHTDTPKKMTEPITEPSTPTNSVSVSETPKVSDPESPTVAKLLSQIETLTGENAQLKTQLDATATTHLSLDSINSRLNTLARIGKIKLDSLDLEQSATAMQRQHISSLNPAINLVGKSDEYIAGMFDSLCGDSPEIATGTENPTVAKVQQQLAGTRSDSSSSNTDPIAVARQKRLAQIETGFEKQSASL